MPVQLTTPGVYIEEVESGVHTITGVATSVAAFVGYTARGPDNRAKRIFSFADFDRLFGGLSPDSELSYAVQHFFQNGGAEAYVVRVPRNDAKAATLTLRDKVKGAGIANVLKLSAQSTGAWANALVVEVDYDGIDADDTSSFNLTVTDTVRGVVERFRGVSVKTVKSVVNDEDSGSRLITVETVGLARPAQSGTVSGNVALDADGKPTGFKQKQAQTIRVSVDGVTPPIKNELITLLPKEGTIPTSVGGLCRWLERALTGELGKFASGASVRCTAVMTPPDGATPAHANLRLVASLPDHPDAVMTFTAGDSAGDNDNADKALKLSTGTANVARYWFGTARPPAFGVGDRVAAEDGDSLPKTAALIGDETDFSGIYALSKTDLFNILCIPDATRARRDDASVLDADLDPNAIFSAAAAFCARRRAFLVIDALPEVRDTETALEWRTSGLKVGDRKNAAAYFPRLRMPDPLNGFKLRSFAPCGVVAGLFARIDGARGVWKAPAGVEAALVGVQGVTYKLTDPEQGALNPIGLNCFRIFPIYGPVSWGARTLAGADAEASEWKYVPVRRFALFLEESLFRGTKWIVFEPNDEPLWAQIRLNIGAFMHTLFRQGAFQGRTPREAYFVKCDSETTTQDDINRGVVNILVGFAPLKPAEFVVIHIQQMAGEIQV